MVKDGAPTKSNTKKAREQTADVRRKMLNTLPSPVDLLDWSRRLAWTLFQAAMPLAMSSASSLSQELPSAVLSTLTWLLTAGDPLPARAAMRLRICVRNLSKILLSKLKGVAAVAGWCGSTAASRNCLLSESASTSLRSAVDLGVISTRAFTTSKQMGVA